MPLDEDAQALRDTLRRFLSDKSPSPRIRTWMETDTGHDSGLWRELALDLGIAGSEGGFAWTALIAEELGRALTPTPFLSTIVLAQNLLTRLPSSPRRAAILAGIGRGETATVAWVESGGRGFDLEATQLAAKGASGKPRFTGEKTLVLDGHTAEHLVLVVRNEDGGWSVASVDAEAPGLDRSRLRTLDRTRRLGHWSFEDVPLEILADDAETALRAVLDEATIALCADAVGGFRAVVDAAAEHARTRRQFGRAIGSFQAIKHKLADLWIQFEAAQTATRRAVASADESAPKRALHAHIAKAYVGDTYRHACREYIQILGGAGFTWEVDAHLYLRRAEFDRVFLGDPAFHLEHVARHLEAAA